MDTHLDIAVLGEENSVVHKGVGRVIFQHIQSFLQKAFRFPRKLQLLNSLITVAASENDPVVDGVAE